MFSLACRTRYDLSNVAFILNWTCVWKAIHALNVIVIPTQESDRRQSTEVKDSAHKTGMFIFLRMLQVSHPGSEKETEIKMMATLRSKVLIQNIRVRLQLQRNPLLWKKSEEVCATLWRKSFCNGKPSLLMRCHRLTNMGPVLKGRVKYKTSFFSLASKNPTWR